MIVVIADTHLPKGQRRLPRSPTERRRAPRRSLGLLNVDAGGLAFEHVWLEETDGG